MIGEKNRLFREAFAKGDLTLNTRKMALVFSAVVIITIGGFFLSLYLGSFKITQTPSSKANSSSLTLKKPGESLASADTAASQDETSSGKETYWLHDSDLKLPEQDACKKAQQLTLEGLNDAQVKEVQDKVREEHMRIEHYLANHVKILKSSSSPFWAYLERTGTISIPGDSTVWNEWDKDTIIEDLKGISAVIKNEAVKFDFKRMEDTLQTAVGQHNLRKVFLYHEMIHDYDYWVINYPVFISAGPPADWGGIKTYFGQPCLLVSANGNAVSAVH